MERFSDTRRMHFPASVLIKTHFTGYVPLFNEHLSRERFSKLCHERTGYVPLFDEHLADLDH